MHLKLGIILLLFVFASCKSDYQCICVNNGQEVGVQNYENVTRSQAVSSCDAYQTVIRLTNPGAICASPY
ncbi:MAG: hypothetical protein KDC84_07655 [Crocinitomicaceae bacterium]|nr:hypothetical protein [Crocinitomicaceae bacterium]